MVEALGHVAEPIVGIEKSKVALQEAVDPQAGKLRRLSILAEILEVGASKADTYRTKIAEVGKTDDQQPVEFWVVGIVFEERAGAGPDDRRLNRANAGQLLESAKVGVEQDPAV